MAKTETNTSQKTVWNTSIKTIWEKLSWKERLSSFALSLVGVLIVVLFGLRPSANIGSEVINGILGANGIIFGFWVAIVGIAPKESKELWRHKKSIKTGIFSSLAILIVSVFLIYGNALGFLPSSIVLFLSVLSFYWTCVFLGITLYYGIFST